MFLAGQTGLGDTERRNRLVGAAAAGAPAAAATPNPFERNVTMNQIRLALLATSLALVPASSKAADSLAMPRKALPPQVEARIRDWSGAYLGIHAGLDANAYRSSAPASLPALNFSGTRDTIGIGGGDVGVQFGYNLQLGNWVTGIEAESSLLLMHKETSAANLVARQTSRHAIKGKLGYSFGPTLLYGVAGLAIAPVRFTSPANGGFPDTSRSTTYLGPTIGIGVEHMLTEHVSLKGEATLASFGKHTLNFPGGSTRIDGAELSLKGGLNFHF